MTGPNADTVLQFFTAFLVLANTVIVLGLHRRVATVDDRVATVAHELNSVKDELVATTGREALARGVKSETDKGEKA